MRADVEIKRARIADAAELIAQLNADLERRYPEDGANHVSPAARGRRIGTALCEALEVQAHALGPPTTLLRALSFAAFCDTGLVDDPARLRIEFPCQFGDCRRAAAIVEVSKRGQLYINDEQDIIYRIFPGAQGTIRVTGFLPYTNFSSQVPDLAATTTAVCAVDAGALSALDQTWVPFYCPHCDRSFCAEHWSLKPTFNWGFDHYSGTCPAGHPHFIDHC